ncbi:hypothetical protein CYMTET_23367 [Cymbomonas tetramitiformis]|uniref:Uncharacterized protein n=1 Tax=Cymbomonas tetramitiformis TaxID=36881 RepID=A0AAE0L107_9CHLO|nr:hypothetical protein CYMTET_23367 [Cymbomonas tetramitiformis]
MRADTKKPPRKLWQLAKTSTKKSPLLLDHAPQKNLLDSLPRRGNVSSEPSAKVKGTLYGSLADVFALPDIRSNVRSHTEYTRHVSHAHESGTSKQVSHAHESGASKQDSHVHPARKSSSRVDQLTKLLQKEPPHITSTVSNPLYDEVELQNMARPGHGETRKGPARRTSEITMSPFIDLSQNSGANQPS